MTQIKKFIFGASIILAAPALIAMDEKENLVASFSKNNVATAQRTSSYKTKLMAKKLNKSCDILFILTQKNSQGFKKTNLACVAKHYKELCGLLKKYNIDLTKECEIQKNDNARQIAGMFQYLTEQFVKRSESAHLTKDDREKLAKLVNTVIQLA